MQWTNNNCSYLSTSVEQNRKRKKHPRTRNRWLWCSCYSCYHPIPYGTEQALKRTPMIRTKDPFAGGEFAVVTSTISLWKHGRTTPSWLVQQLHSTISQLVLSSFIAFSLASGSPPYLNTSFIAFIVTLQCHHRSQIQIWLIPLTTSHVQV